MATDTKDTKELPFEDRRKSENQRRRRRPRLPSTKAKWDRIKERVESKKHDK